VAAVWRKGLRDLRGSGGPSFYYAGREFAGLPLRHAVMPFPGRAVFAYGRCSQPPKGGGLCHADIQNYPFDVAGGRAFPYGCKRQASLRGVPTVRDDKGLVLVTGRTVIKIYAPTVGAERRLALALVDVRHPDRTPRRLPPPPTDVKKVIWWECR
jgi:hypothetical protein